MLSSKPAHVSTGLSGTIAVKDDDQQRVFHNAQQPAEYVKTFGLFLVDWNISSKYFLRQNFDSAMIIRFQEKTKGKS